MTGLQTQTGYGRTRCPKNLAGSHGANIMDGSGLGTGNPVDGSTGGSLGTENQRFLHMLLDTSGADQLWTITLKGYNHAFGVWMPLFEGGSAITIAADNTVAHKTVDIVGTDWVYFQVVVAGGGSMNPANKFYAACSTF